MTYSLLDKGFALKDGKLVVVVVEEEAGRVPECFLLDEEDLIECNGRTPDLMNSDDTDPGDFSDREKEEDAFYPAVYARFEKVDDLGSLQRINRAEDFVLEDGTRLGDSLKTEPKTLRM